MMLGKTGIPYGNIHKTIQKYMEYSHIQRAYAKNGMHKYAHKLEMYG